MKQYIFYLLLNFSKSEYLFLLSILTSKDTLKKLQPNSIFIVNFCFVCWLEPKSGFHIAFNMFDTDGNARVDKQEFMVVSKEIHSSDKVFIVYCLQEYTTKGL